MSISLEPIWVDNNDVLAELCDVWSQQAAIAVDTEFMRVSTFYPIAGLIQIGDGKGCYLIDPLAITDFAPLAALFINPAVTKVLHACSEDLEVFKSLLGVIPAPLFDTQVAASFAGYGFSIGYAGLIKATLEIELSKGETRSDWLQRPLSQSQLKYAALDVGYLLIAYGKLLLELQALERIDWVLADCAKFNNPASPEYMQNNAYLKVKSGWKLSSRELAVLKALSLWRERVARERDIPRNRLMKERALWELAKRKPKKESLLFNIEGLLPRVIYRDGEDILAQVQLGLALDAADLPARLPMPLPLDQTDLLKALKVEVRSLAERLELPAEVLVRKKDYEFIIRSGINGGNYQLPDNLLDWRQGLVGDLLLNCAKNF